MKACLGIDIGGSHIKYALGTRELGLLLSSSIPTPNNDLSSFKAAFRHIVETVHSSQPLYQISAIGIGTPGTIDLVNREIRGVNPNLPFWTGQDPSSLIPKELGIPVVFDNDANLMALAESEGCENQESVHLQGRSPAIHGFAEADGCANQESVLGITVGTGIGSGFVYQGKIFHGGRGFAMELGHISMVPNGELCNCGLQGCLEAYSSLSGIRKRAAQLDPEFALLNPHALLELAGRNQELAQVIEEGRIMLCRALSNAIIILDPDRVIIGGGCMDGGLYSITSLEEDIRRLLPEVNQHSRISAAKLGNKAGVWGAIMLAEAVISSKFGTELA